MRTSLCTTRRCIIPAVITHFCDGVCVSAQVKEEVEAARDERPVGVRTHAPVESAAHAKAVKAERAVRVKEEEAAVGERWWSEEAVKVNPASSYILVYDASMHHPV
jgi:hypothetical protein